MNRTIRDYLIGFIIAAVVFLVAVMAKNRIEQSRYQSLSRAIDTVNVGTGANTGTGDPLRTAFLKVNEAIKIMDSLDLELLTNEEVQVLQNATPLTDAVLFTVGDTTVTALVGRVVFKTSDLTFYGCVRATPTTRWEALN